MQVFSIYSRIIPAGDCNWLDELPEILSARFWRGFEPMRLIQAVENYSTQTMGRMLKLIEISTPSRLVDSIRLPLQ